MYRIILPFLFLITLLSACSSSKVQVKEALAISDTKYMADSAMFKECATGARYPVAYEEANIDLERA